jgi:two-component system, OmpR family, copper resistance phosphate regulon response regulator CusR
MRILVVEDEKRIASAIRKGLIPRGYDVTVAHNGEEGFYLMNMEAFDLVVLDVMLPSRDGFEILGAMRKLGSKVPVLILTAKDSVEDIVRGLDAGADAYLVKPFALPELQARIASLLKRGGADANSILMVNDLRIDVSNRSASRGGVSISLTSREFALLEYLLRNKNNVVSRQMLAREVWKSDQSQAPLENIIDVTVSRLRRKIDDPFQSNLVQTVRGVGYAIREHAA